MQRAYVSLKFLPEYFHGSGMFLDCSSSQGKGDLFGTCIGKAWDMSGQVRANKGSEMLLLNI